MLALRPLSVALRRSEDLSDRKTRSDFPHASGHDLSRFPPLIVT